jgi:hypothetical protein
MTTFSAIAILVALIFWVANMAIDDVDEEFEREEEARELSR